MPLEMIVGVIKPTKDVFDGEANGNETLYPPEDRVPTIAFSDSQCNLDEVSDSPGQD